MKVVLFTSILIKSKIELIKSWWNTKSVLQHTLLPLQANVLGPFHEMGQVAFGGKVLTDSKVLGPPFKERILFRDGLLFRGFRQFLLFQVIGSRLGGALASPLSSGWSRLRK